MAIKIGSMLNLKGVDTEIRGNSGIPFDLIYKWWIF